MPLQLKSEVSFRASCTLPRMCDQRRLGSVQLVLLLHQGASVLAGRRFCFASLRPAGKHTKLPAVPGSAEVEAPTGVSSAAMVEHVMAAC